jgi:TetR/AcrR family transcriptional repressor of nem operon
MKRKINREDILLAGLELIHLNGFHATGVKEITDAVDIPKGSFYNHFESKEEFGLELLEYYGLLTLLRLERKSLMIHLPPLERLRGFFQDMIDGFIHQKDFKYGCMVGNFCIEMGDVSAEFAELGACQLIRIQAGWIALLREAQQRGELDAHHDPIELASFIANAWQGALVQMKATHSAYPLQMFVKYVFEGILKPTPSIDSQLSEK